MLVIKLLAKWLLRDWLVRRAMLSRSSLELADIILEPKVPLSNFLGLLRALMASLKKF